MEAVFLKLLNMSIAASWLVLAVLILRVLLQKAPKTIRCALWGLVGILRPRIYLPSTLDAKQITHVIAHETAHLKRYDHIWKPLGFALLTVYWFNPVMWFAYILLCRDIELACDEMVIREMDTGAKKSYSKALLSCSVPSHKIAACPLAFGETGVKSRIKAVLQYKKPALLLTAAAVIVCIITAVCFLTNPKQTDSPQNTAQPDTLEARLAPEKWTKEDYLHYIYADTEWMWAPSLTLQTDDGLYHYTFHAEGTSLIFDAANSSTIRCFVKPSSIEREQQITVPDGGAFVPESDVYYTE